MNIKKKIAAVILAATTLCSVAALPISANAASYEWRKGGFSGGTCWTTSQYFRREKRNPRINFYSYDGSGRKVTGQTMQIEVYNCDTGYTYEWHKNMSCNGSYKLEGNASKYRIRIRRIWNRKGGSCKWWAMRSNGGCFSNY